jgi:hypothetical protein
MARIRGHKSLANECHNVLTADMYTPSGNGYKTKSGRKAGHNTEHQEDIDVCLRCTKEKCSGEKACRDKMKKGKV